jgi:hypothetical protein
MEQFNSFTIPIKKEKVESFSAIIIADRKFNPVSGDGTTIIENHVSQIRSVYKNPDITYIGGAESVKVKDKVPDIRVIENYNFTNTNDASNIRLAMMYNIADTLLLFKCGVSVTNIQLNRILQHNNNCTIVSNKSHRNIGVTVVDGKITFIAYGLEYEWIPMCLFNKKQVQEFYKVVMADKPNKMFHELVNTHIENYEMEAIL